MDRARRGADHERPGERQGPRIGAVANYPVGARARSRLNVATKLFKPFRLSAAGPCRARSMPLTINDVAATGLPLTEDETQLCIVGSLRSKRTEKLWKSVSRDLLRRLTFLRHTVQ